MNDVEILCVVGARPNFMKIAPLLRVMAGKKTRVKLRLVHTGQHYDDAMSRSFFEQLGIPPAAINLDVGSGSHAVQTAEVMKRFEPVVDRFRPAAVLVVGDVNSTIACALVAVKKNVAVMHVEAGLRSYDRSMPEEINRVLTDQIADLLFTTERSALDNLVREGIDPERVHFVGNVMIDTLLANLDQAVPAEETLRSIVSNNQDADPGTRITEQGYAVLTLHRPANVDDRQVLERLLQEIRRVSDQLPLIFPVHPRTQARIEAGGLQGLLDTPNLLRTPPLSYLELLGLMAQAKLVLTDSGGIQEETTALGIPCITLRENTERPVTVSAGTNVVVGTDPVAIRQAVDEVLATGGKAGRIPEYWDGKAALRIADVIDDWVSRR